MLGKVSGLCLIHCHKQQIWPFGGRNNSHTQSIAADNFKVNHFN